MQTVAILGLGYVGFPLVELLVRTRRYRVLGFDIDSKKILTAERKLRRNNRFHGSRDFSLLASADIIIVCVPTPVFRNFMPDFRPLKSACRTITKYLHPGQLVIIESTINPGACEEIVLPLLKRSGLQEEQDFFLAHCPERIDPGNKKWRLENIPRCVAGIGTKSTEKAEAFYRSFIKAPVLPLDSIKAAEATKIMENTFRDINIAYVNELAMSFDRMGIDIMKVIEGAKTKPFAFLPHYPGIGVGGHCIAQDPYYLIERARKSGFETRFMKMARAVNNGMPAYAVSLLEQAVKLEGLSRRKITIGILGLAYKKDIDDIRESPALKVIEILERKGCQVEAFDPFLPKQSTVPSLSALVKKCQALVLATAHTAFQNLTPQQLQTAGVKIFIDGRNVFEPEAFQKVGIRYYGIGRGLKY